MGNPFDPCPNEEHHPARRDGPTESIPWPAHRQIHADERDAVRKIMEEDGLTGNPGNWTAKQSKWDKK